MLSAKLKDIIFTWIKTGAEGSRSCCWNYSAHHSHQQTQILKLAALLPQKPLARQNGFACLAARARRLRYQGNWGGLRWGTQESNHKQKDPNPLATDPHLMIVKVLLELRKDRNDEPNVE